MCRVPETMRTGNILLVILILLTVLGSGLSVMLVTLQHYQSALNYRLRHKQADYLALSGLNLYARYRGQVPITVIPLNTGADWCLNNLAQLYSLQLGSEGQIYLIASPPYVYAVGQVSGPGISVLRAVCNPDGHINFTTIHHL